MSNNSTESTNFQNEESLTDSLNSFLTSSLNIELVYTILIGISGIALRTSEDGCKNGGKVGLAQNKEF